MVLNTYRQSKLVVFLASLIGQSRIVRRDTGSVALVMEQSIWLWSQADVLMLTLNGRKSRPPGGRLNGRTANRLSRLCPLHEISMLARQADYGSRQGRKPSAGMYELQSPRCAFASIHGNLVDETANVNLRGFLSVGCKGHVQAMQL
jgi:hypothetical protein